MNISTSQQPKTNQNKYFASQKSLVHQQIEENIIPEWKKMYIDVNLVDSYIYQLQQSVTSTLQYQVILDMNKQITKASQFIDDQIDIFSQKFNDLKNLPQTQSFRSEKFKESFLNNIFELYKHISLMQNFGSVNASILQYFIDSCQTICMDLDLTDFSDEIDQNYMSFKFTDSNFYKSKKISVIRMFSKRTKITFTKAQNDLDKSLLPQQIKINSERTTHILLGFNIALSIMVFITFMTELSWYFGIDENLTIRLTHFQEFMIRYQMGYQCYQLILCGIFRLCETVQINWLFILGIEKSHCPVGAKQLFKKVLFSFSVTTFFCVLSIIRNTTDSHEEIPVLQMQFGFLFAKIAQLIEADYWLFFPLLLLFANLLRGVIEILIKDEKLAAFLFRLQLNTLFPYFVQPKMATILASIDFASIPMSMVHIGQAFSFLIMKKDLPGWAQCLLLNIPMLLRHVQLIKLLKIKPGFYPHGMNMLKFSGYIPFTLLSIKQVKEIKVLKNLILCFELFDTLFKVYYDICQDFGLFISGHGSHKFHMKPEEWKNKILCRRPSCLPIWCHAFYVVIDIVLRYSWVPKYFFVHPFLQGFTFDTIYLFCYIIRTSIVMLPRLDNYQATNQEDLLVNNYVPLPIEQRNQEQLLQKKFNIASYDLVDVDELSMSQAFRRNSSTVIHEPLIVSIEE